uniref:C2H2-type domain-containing protein n=1 Tax=Panagrolaimus davidi TaxID=227884 RepID=A0A914Q8K2_9BILA
MKKFQENETESRNDEIQETFIDSTTAKSTSNFVTPVTQRCSQKRQRNITSTASSILTIANTTIQETPDGSDLLTQRSEKPVKVYRCKWAICNSQFDCIEALYEHIKTSHTSNKVKGQYICLWKSCKEKDAFQSVNRLNRHIRDKLKKKN